MNYYSFIPNLMIKVRGHDTQCICNQDLNLQKVCFVYLIEQYAILFQ